MNADSTCFKVFCEAHRRVIAFNLTSGITKEQAEAHAQKIRETLLAPFARKDILQAAYQFILNNYGNKN